ncbi:hypothetical protein [uncultured Formosa sp.]|uniref:hypothetical protein n=1 Tax=uncultured Formosa sp. TaxID=255435 RepID=UPI002614F08A|nr:hypothetical protein [uncultured Formosa sp.]
MPLKLKNCLIIALLISSFSHTQTLKGIITINPLRGIGDNTVLSKKNKIPKYHSYTFSNNKSIQKLISTEGTTIDTVIVEHPNVDGLTMETTEININANKLIIYKDFINDVFRLEASQKNRNLVTE